MKELNQGCRIVGLMLVLLCSSMTFSLKAQKSKFITREEAFEAVSALFEGRDVDYYDAIYPLAALGASIDFFVDADPTALWEHECYLVKVNKSVPVIIPEPAPGVTTIKLSRPPKDYTLNPRLVKIRYEGASNENFIVTKDDSDLRFLNKKGGQTYAVIFSGNFSTEENYEMFWNDCSYMYQILRHRYGISKNNITALISDGDDPAPDMTRVNGNIASSSIDLDFDNVPDYNLAATKANIKQVFQDLRQTVKPHDQLFLFISCHGGPVGYGDNPTFVCVHPTEECAPQDSILKASELKSMLHPFCADSVNVNVVVGACASGGFVNELSEERCVVAASTEQGKNAYGGVIGKQYDIFLHYWMNAVDGYDYKKKVVDADYDNDGIVSMEEAFRYASSATKEHFARSEKEEIPQYISSPIRLGKQLAFNNIPIINDADFYDLNLRNNVLDNDYSAQTPKAIFWNSPDIYVRSIMGDKDVSEYQNPDFDHYHAPFFSVNTIVHNDGEDVYTGGKKLITYWAQASTNIDNGTWLGKNSYYYDGERPLGGRMRETKIGRIAPGESIVVNTLFKIPNEVLEEPYRPENHYYCVLSQIVDSAFVVGDNDVFNIGNDSKLAMSNVSVLPHNAEEQSATVFVHNPLDSIEAYSLELGFRSFEDKSIFRYAHIAIDTKGTVFNSWYNRGGGHWSGMNFYGRSPFCLEFFNENSCLYDIEFVPYGIGRATLYVDFYNAPIIKKKFTFDLIQRNSRGEIVGGETFIVESPQMITSQPVPTDSLTLPDGSLQLRARVAGDTSVKWFTTDNEYAGTGETLVLTPEMRSKKYSVVATTQNGELQVGDVAIDTALPVWSVSPDGLVTTHLDITFVGEEVQSYLLTLTSLTTGKAVMTRTVSTSEKTVNIDMTPYPSDLYIISCAKDGNVVASHKFRKN